VQAWCTPRATSVRPSLAEDEPDSALRSMSLCPAFFAGDPRSVVWSVVGHRASGRAHGTRPGLAGGRLLFYEPARELADGAACAASAGFFDVHNAPPWDTWLCFADDRFLVAWVPPPLLDRAADGIEVNPEQCILWAADAATPFTELLRVEGLL